MTTNLDRYKTDLGSLIDRGETLHLSIQAACYPEQFEKAFQKKLGAKTKAAIKALPDFTGGYQAWYSEAKALVRQLLPDRLGDFTRHYEKPKPRKDITYESYRIADYLQGLTVTRGYAKERVVGPDAAIPHFRQQIAILGAAKARFESSLFDIRQLVQADLFDSELGIATELAKKGFLRAAGAIAGVLLEKHLAQVAQNHSVSVTKKAPTIGDLNDALKAADVIVTPQWRFIQHLADVRNLCDHNKKAEPTRDQVDDLVQGVGKIMKTLF